MILSVKSKDLSLLKNDVTARNQSLHTLDSTSDVIESNIEDKSSTLDSNLVVFSSVCKLKRNYMLFLAVSV